MARLHLVLVHLPPGHLAVVLVQELGKTLDVVDNVGVGELTGAEALERFGLGTRSLQDIVRAQANIAGVCWLLSYVGLSLTRQKYLVMDNPKSEQ